MSFGTIIKELRRERDLTQEELAETLNISPQAVSRWENDVAMPDISMLPILCNYFNVSADILLGIDIEKKRQRIKEICNDADKYSARGYYKEAREILESGLREYPDSLQIMRDLMYLAHWQYIANQKETGFRSEAIKLGEVILEKSTDDDLRQSAKQVLCYTYKDAGNIEEAKKLARSMSCIACSSEMLLSYICDGDEGYRAKQTEAYDLLQFLSNRVSSMQTKLDSGEFVYTEDELAVLRDKRIALLHLFFENGDFCFFHTHLCDTHESQAVYYAKSGDKEKALFHLMSAAEHAIGFVTFKDDRMHTSLIFRNIDRGNWSGSNTDNDAARLLKKLDDTVFDGIRDMSGFIEIKEKLKQYADKWQVK